ncbi:MAG: hypothetical protein M0Q88_08445 [Bacilli bacterium]|nr:hypothetical protein [Bacilli bacterium]
MFSEQLNGYIDVFNSIVEKSGGNFDRMSYTEKVMVIMIVKEYKKELDKFLESNYKIIENWASLDVRDIALNEKYADLSMLEGSKFEREFNKMMGVV